MSVPKLAGGMIYLCHSNAYLYSLAPTGTGYGCVFERGGNLRFIHNPLVAIHKEMAPSGKTQRLARTETTLYYSVGSFNETTGETYFTKLDVCNLFFL